MTFEQGIKKVPRKELERLFLSTVKILQRIANDKQEYKPQIDEVLQAILSTAQKSD